MQQLYILFAHALGYSSLLGWLMEMIHRRHRCASPQWGDNCCRNNCCSTGKLPEFTQYSYINVMLVVGVVDSE